MVQEIPDKIHLVTIMEVWSEKLPLPYEMLLKKAQDAMREDRVALDLTERYHGVESGRKDIGST
jgi:hypothetical protein